MEASLHTKVLSRIHRFILSPRSLLMEAFGAAVGAEIVGGVASSIVAVGLNAGTPFFAKVSPSARASNAEKHTTAARELLEADFRNMDPRGLNEARQDLHTAKDAREKYKQSTAFFERLSRAIEFEQCGMKAYETAYVVSSRTREQILSRAIYEEIGPYEWSETQDPFHDPKDPLPDDGNSLRPSLIKRVWKRMKKKSTRANSIPLRPVSDISESTEGTIGSHEWQEEAVQDHPPSVVSSSTELPKTAVSSVTSGVGPASRTLQDVDAAVASSAS